MNEPVFVLVHGSWFGGWCWEPVQKALAQAGFRSTAPTLSGVEQGAGTHGPSIGLRRHVEDIVGHIDSVEAGRIVLVGHSYGGAVAIGAASARPDRVGRVVVLDGFILDVGQSIFVRYPEVEAVFRSLAEGEIVPPPPADFLGFPLDHPGLDAIMARLSPMPIMTHSEALLAGDESVSCSKNYVRFNRFPVFADLAAQLASGPWQVEGIDAGHVAILTDPEAVSRCLLELERVS